MPAHAEYPLQGNLRQRTPRPLRSVTGFDDRERRRPHFRAASPGESLLSGPSWTIMAPRPGDTAPQIYGEEQGMITGRTTRRGWFGQAAKTAGAGAAIAAAST